MGLDMMLNARRYVSAYSDKELLAKLNEAAEGVRKDFDIQYITIEVMYWRKSNQIHNWFVKNVQNGVDDCGYYYVSQEKLGELLADVSQVLLDHSKAEELLPTQSGFFFGGTSYDACYFSDLQMTQKALIDLFDKFDDGEGNLDYNWSFEYHSSW